MLSIPTNSSEETKRLLKTHLEPFTSRGKLNLLYSFYFVWKKIKVLDLWDLYWIGSVGSWQREWFGRKKTKIYHKMKRIFSAWSFVIWQYSVSSKTKTQKTHKGSILHFLFLLDFITLLPKSFVLDASLYQ